MAANITDITSIPHGATESNISASSIYTPAQKYTIVIAGTLLSFITAGGNLLVLLSFRVDKTLQIISNYFLFSLAVADLAIGVISCPFMTLYTAVGRWPLGAVVCNFWLSIDYCMSNASVWNLLLISLDRYFSVTKPLTYRPKRTTKKALFMIASTYILSVVLWPPWIVAWPYIENRFDVVPETECAIQFLYTNTPVTIATIMAAFYIPVTVMVFLYAKVYWVTETRNRGLTALQGYDKTKLMTSYKKPTTNSSQNESYASREGTVRLTDGHSVDGTGPEGQPLAADMVATSRRSRCPCFPGRRTRLRRMIPDEFGSQWSCANEDSGDSQMDLSDEHVLGAASSISNKDSRCSIIMNDSVKRKPESADGTYTVVIKFPTKTSTPPEPKISIYDSDCETEKTSHAGPEDKLLEKRSVWTSAQDGSVSTCRTTGSAAIAHRNMQKSVRAKSANRLRTAKLRIGGKKSRNSEKRQERKAAKTLSAILFAFILTWAPYSIIICIETINRHYHDHRADTKTLVPTQWFNFSYYLCYINSTINPILYALCNENFRKTYIRILKCDWSKPKPKPRGSVFVK